MLFCISDSGAAVGPVAAADLQELQAITKEIQAAILSEDTDKLLSHISRTEDFWCTDTNYSFSSVKNYLQDETSHLYLHLYDSDTWSSLCGIYYPRTYPAISEKEFLKTVNEVASIDLLDNVWAQVVLSSPVDTHYERTWYFHRDQLGWKLSGRSFIIGGCHCG